MTLTEAFEDRIPEANVAVATTIFFFLSLEALVAKICERKYVYLHISEKSRCIVNHEIGSVIWHRVKRPDVNFDIKILSMYVGTTLRLK